VESQLSNRRKIQHIERSHLQTPKRTELINPASGDVEIPKSTKGSVVTKIRDDPLNEKNLFINSIIQSVKADNLVLESLKYQKATIDAQKEMRKTLFQTKAEFYKIGKVIGKGAFGKVNLAIHRLSGKFVALKSISKEMMQDESSLKKVM